MFCMRCGAKIRKGEIFCNQWSFYPMTVKKLKVLPPVNILADMLLSIKESGTSFMRDL